MKQLDHRAMLLELLKLHDEATDAEISASHAAILKRAQEIERVLGPNQTNTVNSWREKGSAARTAAFNVKLAEFMRPASTGGKGYVNMDNAIAAMCQDAECAPLLQAMGK